LHFGEGKIKISTAAGKKSTGVISKAMPSKGNMGFHLGSLYMFI
jgi:hypothetical protein